MKKKILMSIILIAFLTAVQFTPITAATPPDIIHSMVVDITPQPDGSFTMVYTFDYEATTDFPSDIKYLEIGVPNSDFILQSYAPTSLISKGYGKRGSSSQVHLSFKKLPKAGDRFQFSFTIKQNALVYKASDEVSFQFRPGWFDFAEIKEVKVLINTSVLDQVNLKPAASGTESGKAIWVTKNLKPDEKTKMITVTCARSSFPKLADRDMVTKSSKEFLVFAGVLTLIVLYIAIWLGVKSRQHPSFLSGRYAGGYHGGTINHASTTIFHGGGGGCACACACACAGGGRVGCSERGYQVLYWMLHRK